MDKHLNLANRLYEVFRGNLTCINTWGVYLFNSDFDNEPELRNKVGIIWICALFDTLEADNKFIPQIIKEAKEEGFDSLVHNGIQLQNLCKLTSELLGSFTKQEQIFMIDLRNQWTHGYLANRHRNHVSVKYSEDGKIKYEKLPHSKYSEITRDFYEKGNLDDTIQPLIKKALDPSHRYWQAVGELKRYDGEMYRILREGEIFNISV